MSAEIASIPLWKQALLERKRRQDNDGQSCPPGGLYRNDGQESVSGWSRSILAKKQKQKNTIVFMAKQPTDSRHNQPETCVEAALAGTSNHYSGVQSTPVVTNGHKGQFSGNGISDVGELSIHEASMAVIDLEIPSMPLVEERLLPIHTNPILRLDLEKRQHASVHCLRSSESRSLVNGSTAHLSTTDNDEPTSLQNGFQSVCDVGNEEVFGEGGNMEDEVTYGKGFVHKLLMKFSHLSSSENASTPLTHVSRNCRGSSGEGPNSTLTSPLNDLRLPTLSSVDCSISARGNSRVKFHSVDDIMSESQVQMTRFDDESECESSRTTHNGDFDISGDCGMIANSELISVRKNSLGDGVDEEGLALANIVSNTRSIFEKLVVSPVSPKPPVSPKSPKLSGMYVSSNCGLSCSAKRLSSEGPVERKQISNNNKRWSGGQVNMDAQAHIESHNSANVASASDNFAKQATDKNMNNIITDGHPPAQIQFSSSVPQFVKDNNDSVVRASESSSVKDDSATIIHNVDNHISAENAECQAEVMLARKPEVATRTLTEKCEIDDNLLPLKPSDVRMAAQPMMNGFSKPVFHSGNASMMSDLFMPGVKSAVTAEAVVHPVKAEMPNVPVVLSKPSSISTAHLNAVNEKQIGFDEAAPGAITKQKPTINANNRRTPLQKSGSSRPGMLLIRPASNLAASKTKSEYLELTKYNDVRKGEFAPAVRRPISTCDLDDEDWTDAGDAEGLDAAALKVSFSGAGVNLGRSLLSKTKQGRQLQCNFDDARTRTFEYPSEQSLMDATPAQPGYIDYDGDASAKSVTTTNTARTTGPDMSSSNVPDYPAGSSGLLTAPNIAAAGALSSYRSRVQVDYLFGMHVTAESTSKKPVSSKPHQTTQAQPSPTETTWSKGASADLLF